jgi:hypothetical protein
MTLNKTLNFMLGLIASLLVALAGLGSTIYTGSVLLLWISVAAGPLTGVFIFKFKQKQLGLGMMIAAIPITALAIMLFLLSGISC